MLGKPSIPTHCTLSVKLTLRFLPPPPLVLTSIWILSPFPQFCHGPPLSGCMVERYTHTLVATDMSFDRQVNIKLIAKNSYLFLIFGFEKPRTLLLDLVVLISIVRMNVGLAGLTGARKCRTVQAGFSKRSLEQES